MNKAIQEDISAGIWFCAALLAFSGNFNFMGYIFGAKAMVHLIFSIVELHKNR